MTGRRLNLLPQDFEWAALVDPQWAWVTDDEGLRSRRLRPTPDDPELGIRPGYRPFIEAPALFRNFADTPPTEAGFAAFANRWGPVKYGADWYWWVAEHGLISEAVALFGALQTGAVHRLVAETLTTRPRGGMVDVFFSERFLAAVTGERLLDNARFPLGTRQTPAFQLPKSATETQFARFALRAILQQVPRSVTPSMELTGEPGIGLSLTLRASTLADVMWIQLLLAVDGNREYEQCEECGAWWDATGSNSNRKTCGDTCRQRRSRRIRAEGVKSDVEA